MRASVSVSSGSTCTNCDDRQHAVHPPHGTSASRSPSSAPRIDSSQAEKFPASSSSSTTVRGYWHHHRMLTGLAHTAICVPDVEAAVAWYESVLGMTVLSPPYLMEGEAITRDMGELLHAPVAVKAAIVGVGADDHVIEVLEYPNEPADPTDLTPPPSTIARTGITHVGLVCDDIEATREAYEAGGADFLTAGIADVAGLRTTWFRDPWGVVFILVEKSLTDRPYWRQF